MKQVFKQVILPAFALMPFLAFSQYNQSRDNTAIITSTPMDGIVNSPLISTSILYNPQTECLIFDKDLKLPRFSFSQDLYQLYLNFEKSGPTFSPFDFVLFMDIDNDNKMVLNEPCFRFSWSGNDEKFSVKIYNYIPATKNGDVLAEQKDMPGKLLYRKSINNLSKASLNGEVIDVSIPFMNITRVTGIVILDQLQFDEKFKFHATSTNKMIDNSDKALMRSYWENNIQFISQMTPSIVLYNFTVTKNNNKNYLEWAITENEEAERFEVERSTDGKKFATAALVFTSEKEGNEIYKFYEPSVKGKIFYRLKMFGKNLKAEHSQILALK